MNGMWKACCCAPVSRRVTTAAAPAGTAVKPAAASKGKNNIAEDGRIVYLVILEGQINAQIRHRTRL